MNSTTSTTGLPRAVAFLLVLFALVAGGLLAGQSTDYPDIHTILDTGIALLAAILALLLWDRGRQSATRFPRWLAVTFAITAVLWLVHALVTIEWSGSLIAITTAEHVLRPATSPPPAYLLPIGMAWAVWRLQHGRRGIWGYAVTLAALGLGLFAVFLWMPPYQAINPLGMSRTTLALAPLLWGAVGIAAWRLRGSNRLLGPIALMAGPLLLANIVILYSRTPADGPAIVGHLGTITGYLVLLLSVMQIASQDTRERLLTEALLTRANADLDGHVLERTAQLAAANETLKQEMSVRRQAEVKANAQLERLFLLHQITRAIGERQDLDSIFQVAVRSVESQLPADFACLCHYDDVGRKLTVGAVGVNSEGLAFELAMPERARIDIDENGLSHCVKGHLVYETDIANVDFPFPQRLARGGLRSLVVAPLQVENKVFGVFVVARFKPEGFSSGECEFLRQLSEHAALAAHQAQLYGALQHAYDDLRQSQQVMVQQERLRALGQMASGITHDINNAMSPATLYIESMLETETNLSIVARSHLEVILRAIEDVTQTISRMREFYREREPQLALSPVKLNDLVQQVIALTRARWSDMATQRGVVIDVRTEMGSDLPAIMGVESEIREALINLIFNAVDALPEGGLLTVRTKAVSGATSKEFGSVAVEIEDNGIGMDPETRRRCLEPFFTTKGERGTGLGLAMAYGAAQRHGADMDIRSTPGNGTTVVLSFPGTDAEAGTPVQTDVAPTPPKRLRLLLVDDDPILLKALRDTLEMDGHVLVTANGGQAGIDAYRSAFDRSEHFAAVITDLGMPYIDGRRVAAAVKALSSSTPVILLTGWGQGLVAEEDIPLHVDQVLSKPPKLREIREILAHLCPAVAPD